MTIVRRPSPFGELLPLRTAMDRLFDEPYSRLFWGAGHNGDGIVPLDVTSTPDELIVRASLPGVRPEDVEITIEGGTLAISGSTAAETTDESPAYLVREIRRGSFSRTMTLPDGLEPDGAKASFELGILTLRIPKAAQVKPRQIRITPSVPADARPPETEAHPVEEDDAS
jgi:HSP20 family protein